MVDHASNELIVRFMAEVWDAGNLASLDDFIDPAYHDYTYQPGNRAGLERALNLMNSTFPGHQSMIEEIAAEGDTVGLCLTIRGKHAGVPFRGIPATGKPFVIGAYRFFKIKNGKIVSHRGLLDLPSLLDQIRPDSPSEH